MKKQKNKRHDFRKREQEWEQAREDWFSRRMATDPDYEVVFREIEIKFGFMGLTEFRKSLIRHFAWAIPDAKAIERIAAYSPITEIGAGGGYWAYRIAEFGADIVALDAKILRVPFKDYTWDDVHACTYYNVETCDPDATAPSDRSLFICYPDNDSDMAVNCLQRYEGETFIYVGEWEDGNCANAAFFRELRENWKCVEAHALPYFYEYTSCALMIFERKD